MYKVNSKIYKGLAEKPLTSERRKTIVTGIHDMKTIDDFKEGKNNFPKAEFAGLDEEKLAAKLLRYLRDNPLTKGKRAAEGNIPKIIYQGVKSFFTQIDSISGPKLSLAYQAFEDLMQGATAAEVKKYGLMTCEYIRWSNPILCANQAVSWKEIQGSGKLENVFGLAKSQKTMNESEFPGLFKFQKDHFVTQNLRKPYLQTFGRVRW